MPELVEAAVRSEDHRLAERALEWLAQSTRAGDTDWGRGLDARSRALLSDGDAADRLYREATERLRRTRNRLQLRRAHLLYGELLRRGRPRVDAREQLTPRSRCSRAWAPRRSQGAPSASCWQRRTRPPATAAPEPFSGDRA